MILKELKKLYANFAPQLKPRKRPKPDETLCLEPAAADVGSIDPIEDMYNILEGSALIPFIVVSLVLLNESDSFQTLNKMDSF